MLRPVLILGHFCFMGWTRMGGIDHIHRELQQPASFPTIPQFDPALGQLLDVQATFTGDFSVEFEATPTLTCATFELFVGVSLAREPKRFSLRLPRGHRDSSTTYTGGLGNPFFVEGGFSISNDLTTQLDPFYGKRQLGLFFDANQSLTDLVPVGSLVLPNRGSDSGTVTIIYTFTVPDPPGVVMAGTAAPFGVAAGYGTGCLGFLHRLEHRRGFAV